MKKVLVLLAVVFASVASYAQESTTTESWSGTLSAGIQKLNVCFVIETQSDGTQTCTMDVPEQGAKDIPVELIKNDADSLNMSISILRASYNGRKVSSEDIKGVFVQNGISLPLNLKSGGIELKRPQTPLEPFAYTTEEVVFKNEAEGAVLSGTLTYPVDFESYKNKSVPVVLMVTGSGAQDRNEEVFGHKPFLVIADFLAKNGIASLRYDDRGVGKSSGPVEGMTTENNLADAEAGIAYLRGLDKFGKIGVLGHSEGGTIAFMMGANKSVDFVISLAGGAANGIDLIVGQNEAILQQQRVPQNIASDYATALRIIYKDRADGKEVVNKAEYVEDICKANDLVLIDNLKANLVEVITAGGEWFTWFIRYSPADAIRKIKCPVMALNGNLDLQVLSKDNLPVIKSNLPKNKKNVIKEYDALNHFFQHCTIATAINYGAIDETISEEVLVDIANWINTIK